MKILKNFFLPLVLFLVSTTLSFGQLTSTGNLDWNDSNDQEKIKKTKIEGGKYGTSLDVNLKDVTEVYVCTNLPSPDYTVPKQLLIKENGKYKWIQYDRDFIDDVEEAKECTLEACSCVKTYSRGDQSDTKSSGTTREEGVSISESPFANLFNEKDK